MDSRSKQFLTVLALITLVSVMTTAQGGGGRGRGGDQGPPPPKDVAAPAIPAEGANRA